VECRVAQRQVHSFTLKENLLNNISTEQADVTGWRVLRHLDWSLGLVHSQRRAAQFRLQVQNSLYCLGITAYVEGKLRYSGFMPPPRRAIRTLT